MSSRKSMTLPIIVTFIIIVIIISLFVNIKQTEVVCSKEKNYDFGVRFHEEIETVMDGKKITGMTVSKVIILQDKFIAEENLKRIKSSLDRTLKYLGDKVKYTVGNDRIIVTIDVDKNEIILLDNIDFSVLNDLQIHIKTNTKSNDVIALTVGDNYTDGEFMKMMKNKGYRCK